MPTEAIYRITRGQHQLITRQQVFDCGVPQRTLDSWLGRKVLLVVHPSVYRLPGGPLTPEQLLLAAVLAGGPGAAASHRAAAWLWGLHDDFVVEITVPWPRLPRLREVVVHRSRDLSARPLVRRRRVPVTDPARTLVDLGAVAPAAVVAEALERGLTARLFSLAGVEAAYAAVGRQGRRGCGVVRGVLDSRALGAKPPDGVLEPRMAQLLRDHGLPAAVFQHRVCDERGRFVARVDFAYPAQRLAIEVDGWEAHSSPSALQADLDRQNALVALGWTVLRFTWRDVVDRPQRVADLIARYLCAPTASSTP